MSTEHTQFYWHISNTPRNVMDTKQNNFRRNSFFITQSSLVLNMTNFTLNICKKTIATFKISVHKENV